MNAAAKASVNDIAAGQIKASKDSAKLIGAFTQWAEPSSKCDAHALVACLHKNGDHHAFDVPHSFEGACAQQTGCVWNDNSTYRHATEADAHRVKNAMQAIG